MIRQPIVSVLGHIDHGKTSLLDKIRGSAIAAKEAGGITQHIGATEIPIDVVKKISGPLLINLGFKVTLPGLLFIDTPGHAAFTNLRKRGGSISDIGVLIVDMNEGFKPQTHEALQILKSYETPFMVVANKLDLLPGWQPHPDTPFMRSFKAQRSDVQTVLDSKLYTIVEELYKSEFSSERFDRVKDFTNQIAVVPLSAKTGEGIPEFLMVLTGLTQKYMENKLTIDECSPGKGAVLEVKQTTGLGATIDVILYDGCIKKGDTIVVGTREKPITTNVKALLRPAPLEEIRVGKGFKNVEEINAAAGIKIAAPGLDEALAGAPVEVVAGPEDTSTAEQEIMSQIEEIKIKTDALGVVVKADTLGTLEAMVRMLGEEGIKIRKAGFGDVSKKDVMETEAVARESALNALIFAFNVKVLPDAEQEAADKNIKILSGNVVYSLIDEYKEFVEAHTQKIKEEAKERAVMPGKVKSLPGFVFRQKGPAVFGVEVLAGIVKSGYPLMTEEGEPVGNVKEIQKENQTVQEAVPGDRVAISVPGAIIGKHIKEGDTLYVYLRPRDADTLKTKLKDTLTSEDMELLAEIVEKTKEKQWQ
jgi:translation initiation factor 5B